MVLPRRWLPFPLLLAVAAAQAAPGTAAPDVTFDAVLNAPAPIETLADLRGSAVLLEFWATWCGPCRAQIPHLNELHGTYAERGLVVLGVNFGEQQAVVEPFVKANAIAYPIGFDGAAAKRYGVRGIPQAFLIDPDGTIVWAGHPAKVAAGDIERALVAARPFGAKLTDQLEPVQMLLDSERKGRAQLLLQKLQESGKLEPRAAELAARTLARLHREQQGLLTNAAANAKDGRTVVAAVLWVRAAAQFDGCDAATAAAAELAKLDADDAGKRAVVLARRLEHARALLRDGRIDAARADYEGVAASGDAAAGEYAARGLAAIAARAPAATPPDDAPPNRRQP